MNLRLGIAGAAIALAAAGCAAQGQGFERATAVPNHAIIYVYRPYSFFGSATRPPVQCGEQSVEIKPGAYHTFVVPVGRVTCWVRGEVGVDNLDQLDIEAEGRVYYVRERISWGALWGRPQLNPMDADQAQAEIQNCCVQQP
jgi:hypothetical protein